jgi:hypothetical protein
MTFSTSTPSKKHSFSDLQKSYKSRKDKLSSERDFVLSTREAKAASPADMAVCGEEDPGEGMEFLVTDYTEERK